MLDKNEEIDYGYNLRALYHLNLLLQKTYLVFRQDISDALAAKKIQQFRDIDGKEFLKYEQALSLTRLYRKRVLNFYKQLMSGVNKKQTGGYKDEEKYADNEVYNYLLKQGIRRNTEVSDMLSIIMNQIKDINPITFQLLFKGAPINFMEAIDKLSPSQILDQMESKYPLSLIANMRKYIKYMSLDTLHKNIRKYDEWITENQDLVDFAKAGLFFGSQGYISSKQVYI